MSDYAVAHYKVFNSPPGEQISGTILSLNCVLQKKVLKCTRGEFHILPLISILLKKSRATTSNFLKLHGYKYEMGAPHITMQ